MNNTYIKIFKYRLYPRKSQIKILENIFDKTRYMYNKVLEDIIKDDIDITHFNQININDYKNKYPALRTMSDDILNNVIQEMISDYTNNVNNPNQFRPLHFKGRYQDQTFFAKTIDFSKNNNTNYVKVPYLDSIKIILHRPVSGKILFAKLIYTPLEKFFINIYAEQEIIPQEPIDIDNIDLSGKSILYIYAE